MTKQWYRTRSNIQTQLIETKYCLH